MSRAVINAVWALAAVLSAGPASAQPLELRPGGPKVWEDSGLFWSTTADYALNPNGNLQHRIGLFHWYPPGVGGPIQVTLYHNSADSTFQRGVGFGFRIGPAARLSVAAGGVVTIEEADGTPIAFTPDGAGGFRPETFAQEALSFDGTRYVLRARGGYERVFEDPNQLGFVETTRRDRTGDAVTFTHDATNHLIRIRDSAGRTAIFTRTNGFYTQVTDPLGATFTFTYARGELSAVLGPATGQETPRTQLIYDALQHTIIERRSWGGADASRFSYYPDRRLRSAAPATSMLMRVDYGPARVSVTDSLNRSTVVRYEDGAVVEVTLPSRLTVTTQRDGRKRPIGVVDERGHIFTYAYDDGDNVTAVSNEVSNVRTFVWDDRHNLLELTDGFGLKETYAYGPFDRVTESTNTLGETTTFTHDAAGNLLRIEDFAGVVRFRATYNGIGKKLTETNENNRTWSYTYDQFGNLLSVTEPDLLRSVTQTVSPLGHPLTVTNALGETTRYGYDELNRPTSAARSDEVAVRLQWDLDGRVSRVDNNAGPNPQSLTLGFAGKSSLGTVTTNGVQLQTGAAATTGFLPAPGAGVTP